MPRYKSHAITTYSILNGLLIRFQFLINFNSISIISWVLLSISITISITKTDPYQYQYIINFSKFSLSISIPISILQFFPINISLSMHCATLVSNAVFQRFPIIIVVGFEGFWKMSLNIIPKRIYSFSKW